MSYDGYWYRVFCHSLKEDAEAFMARFGGEWFDPHQRGKGVNWMHYKGIPPVRRLRRNRASCRWRGKEACSRSL
jgi:hypothetical protein